MAAAAAAEKELPQLEPLDLADRVAVVTAERLQLELMQPQIEAAAVVEPVMDMSVELVQLVLSLLDFQQHTLSHLMQMVEPELQVRQRLHKAQLPVR
jgi:hypothetical protein